MALALTLDLVCRLRLPTAHKDHYHNDFVRLDEARLASRTPRRTG